MNLYNECFDGVAKLLEGYDIQKLDIDSCGKWEDVGNNQIIFQNDTAYELGSGNLPAISTLALTDSAELVPDDQVLLVGKDLADIKGDIPFARVTLLRVAEDAMGDGNALYNSIRKLEYTRYHTNPKGYMMRISAFSRRESVRVSKKAIGEGLDFARVGRLFLDAYHQHQQVEAAKIIFITDPDFPYDELQKVMQRSEDITKALDHLLSKINMDCHTCSLRAVCEEVEEMYTEIKK